MINYFTKKELKKIYTTFILIGIIIGFIGSQLFTIAKNSQIINYAKENSAPDLIQTATNNLAPTGKNSPGNHIEENQIHVFDNRISLDIKNASWSRFTDTHSMDPVLNKNSNGIEIIPKSEDQIKVGDIVSYESKYGTGIYIHRIIEKGVDEDGVYFILKGDNNKSEDPGRVRFEQIRGILIAVIY